MEELIFGILQYLSSGMFLYVLIFFLMDQFALGTSIYILSSPNQIMSRQHKIYFPLTSRFQTADAKVLFDVVCNHVLEHFKLRNLM